MLLVPHKNKHCLGFCSGELHKRQALVLTVSASPQLNVAGCSPHSSFPPAPALYQNGTPDSNHQQPDPKKQEFREAFAPAWLEVGSGPLKEGPNTSSLDKWAAYSQQSTLPKPQRSSSKPRDGLSSLSLAFLSLAIVFFEREKKKSYRVDHSGHLVSCPCSLGHTHHQSPAAPWAPQSSPMAFPQSIPCSTQASSSIIQTLNTPLFALLVLIKSDYLISADISFLPSASGFVSVSERKPRSHIKKDLS